MLVVVGALFIFVLIAVDFSRVEPYAYPLHLLKEKPYELYPGVWVGGYLHGDELIYFVKSKRINRVISLLNERMYHEKSLVLYERRVLRRIGVRFYSIPMTPFVREPNKLRKVRNIVSRSKGVYIHSYLGRLRVKYVKEVLNAK